MVMNSIFILFMLYLDDLKANELDLMETNDNCVPFRTILVDLVW